jgi:hypothetical protein
MISSWKKTLNLRTIEALIFPEAVMPAAGAAQSEDLERGERSPFERFAIPYMFQPALRPSQAAIAALRSFLRIFLGSLLFGVWGAYALLLWTSIPNPLLRAAAMIPMIALFLVLLGGLLIATTLVLRPRLRGGG